MSTVLRPISDATERSSKRPSAPTRRGKRRGGGPAASLMARGEPMVWSMGGALAVCLVMIFGLLGYVAYKGFGTFWPDPIVKIRTVGGDVLMGEFTRNDTYRPTEAELRGLPEEVAAATTARVQANGGWTRRRLLRTGNFELTNEHFKWVSDFQITESGETRPQWAIVFERLAWGRFYGEPKAFVIDGATVATAPAEVWSLFERYHSEVRKRWEKRRSLEKNDTGALNHELEAERLRLKKIELRHGVDSAQWKHANDGFTALEARMQGEFEKIRGRIDRLNEENGRYAILMATANGQDKAIRLDDVVRAYPANQLSVFKKAGVYLSRWGEFLAGEPREANSEGGVFPAIFGTVVMTFLMSIVVVPFGVLAALYLREYAKAGPVVSAVRIAINNLAGVPSIVFGVFGLGFFSYIIGVRIDQLFFQAKLPSPTYGTGGILWASFTLALLTLPVVIVATEEALAAVPNSMREGSYACGASKWQTVRRIVLPRAMPGVMTGMILAMARGAGEVAPLMLVGAVKLAPELPIDGYFPYVHLERSFMHLGFHIYDLGFQSQNSEASKPMVFTTTLLLITIVFLLNLLGVILRSRLRRKFVGAAF
jgi:phosphate transport system permease protein